MELRPFLHRDLVAIEKGAIGSPSTKVGNFTYIPQNHTTICEYNWKHNRKRLKTLNLLIDFFISSFLILVRLIDWFILIVYQPV